MKQRARPRRCKKSHQFPFTGLLKCGECGGAITAQFAKGNGGIYRYYRCTKKLHTPVKCKQKYILESLLADDLKAKLLNVALCDDDFVKYNKVIKYLEHEQSQSSQSYAQDVDDKLKDAEMKLDKLVDTFLDGDIEKDIYCRKKEELIKLKMNYAEQKTNLGHKGNNWIEPLKDLVNSAHDAHKLALSDDFIGIKSSIEKIGTNRQLQGKRVIWKQREQWQILQDRKANSEVRGLQKLPPALVLEGISTEIWTQEDSNL